VYCFLGTFTKLQKVTLSFVMSVRSSTWDNLATTAGYSDYENGLLCYVYTCIACHFVFCFERQNPLYLTFLYLYVTVMMTDLFLLGLSPQQQRSRTTTTGRDSRIQGKTGRESETPGGDSKGPGHFMVCLTILQLLFYLDLLFALTRLEHVAWDISCYSDSLRGWTDQASNPKGGEILCTCPERISLTIILWDLGFPTFKVTGAEH